MISMEKKAYKVTFIDLNIYLGGGGMGTGGTGGFRGFGDHEFSFHNAEDVFKNFFGGKDPFAGFMDDGDDMFGGGFYNQGSSKGGNKQQRDPFGGFGGDPFGGFGGGSGFSSGFGSGFGHDPFGGFGGGGDPFAGFGGSGFSSGFSSSSMSGMGGGMGGSTSIKT